MLGRMQSEIAPGLVALALPTPLKRPASSPWAALGARGGPGQALIKRATWAARPRRHRATAAAAPPPLLIPLSSRRRRRLLLTPHAQMGNAATACAGIRPTRPSEQPGGGRAHGVSAKLHGPPPAAPMKSHLPVPPPQV